MFSSSDARAPLHVLPFPSLSNARPRCQAGLAQLLGACQHLSWWLQRFLSLLACAGRGKHTPCSEHDDSQHGTWKYLSTSQVVRGFPSKAHLFWERHRHATPFTAESNQPLTKVTQRQERDVPAAKGSLQVPRGHMAKKGKEISRPGLWREC